MEDKAMRSNVICLVVILQNLLNSLPAWVLHTKGFVLSISTTMMELEVGLEVARVAGRSNKRRVLWPSMLEAAPKGVRIFS